MVTRRGPAPRIRAERSEARSLVAPLLASPAVKYHVTGGIRGFLISRIRAELREERSDERSEARSLLVDYLEDIDAATEYLEEPSTGRFVVPAPAFGEVLVAEGNGSDESDIEGARQVVAWGGVYPVDERTAVTAPEIADEMGPHGPKGPPGAVPDRD